VSVTQVVYKCDVAGIN